MHSDPHPAVQIVIGQTLKDERVKLGRTIEEVSKIVHITPAEMEELEAGRLTPLPHSLVEQIADLYRAGKPRSKFGRLNVMVPPRPLEPSGGVFISYRRGDQAALAGRLYDKLADRFGQDQVFVDVCSIKAGVDYYEVLTHALSQCQSLLAVIGRGWITAADSDGNKRLDDPSDLVRVEIETALKRGIPVIPILVDGAPMPRENDLPESIQLLARRQGQSIIHERFATDVSVLISTLERILGS